MFIVLQKSYTTDILSSNDRDDGERLVLLAGEHEGMYRNLNKKRGKGV